MKEYKITQNKPTGSVYDSFLAGRWEARRMSDNKLLASGRTKKECIQKADEFMAEIAKYQGV